MLGETAQELDILVDVTDVDVIKNDEHYTYCQTDPQITPVCAQNVGQSHIIWMRRPDYESIFRESGSRVEPFSSDIGRFTFDVIAFTERNGVPNLLSPQVIVFLDGVGSLVVEQDISFVVQNGRTHPISQKTSFVPQETCSILVDKTTPHFLIVTLHLGIQQFDPVLIFSSILVENKYKDESEG